MFQFYLNSVPGYFERIIINTLYLYVMDSYETKARLSAKRITKTLVPVFIVVWVIGAVLDGAAHIDDSDARRPFTAGQYAIVYVFLILLFAYISYARTYLKLTKNKSVEDNLAIRLRFIKTLNKALLLSFVIWFANLLILNPTNKGTFIGSLYWSDLLKRAGLLIFVSLIVAYVVSERTRR